MRTIGIEEDAADARGWAGAAFAPRLRDAHADATAFGTAPGQASDRGFGFGLTGAPDLPANVGLLTEARDDRITVSEDDAPEPGAPAAFDVFADNGAGADVDATGQGLRVVRVAGETFAVGVAVGTEATGYVTIAADGGLTFDAGGAYEALAAGDTAERTITYTLADALGTQDTATVTLTIEGRNDAPVARDDTATLSAVRTAVLDPLGNDEDVDAGDALALTHVEGTALTVGEAVALASGASVTLRADGTLTYDPGAALGMLRSGESGADGFVYTVTDGAGAARDAQVTLTIEGEDVPLSLTGTDDADTLEGGDADDTLDGLAGDDLLIGGGGADQIMGGAGSDVLYGDGGPG